MNTVVGTESIEGKSNASGLRKFRLIGVSDVKEINPKLSSWSIPTGGIVLLNPKVVDMKFEGVAFYNEDLVPSEQGDAWQTVVELNVPKDFANRTLSLNSMRGKTFIGLSTDRNGVTKVLGTVRQPLRIVACSLNVGTSTVNIKFGRLSKEPSFYAESVNVFLINSVLVTL